MSYQTITHTYIKKKVTHTKDWPSISGKKKKKRNYQTK